MKKRTLINNIQLHIIERKKLIIIEQRLNFRIAQMGYFCLVVKGGWNMLVNF
jgi:hypothetical protein